MPRLALCNEVIRDLSFERQCEFAASLGYQGLEVAPFTLGAEAHRMGAAQRNALRRSAAACGVAISGLHWLLVAPAGLSITSPERSTRDKTLDVMRRLIELAAELGASYLVHGSPAQRRLDPDDRTACAERGIEAWAMIAPDAAAAGVAYCIEPLAPAETDFVNTVAEAAAIVARIGSPAVRTMIDTSAAAQAEAESVAALVERWLPSGLIAHIQLNDRNRRGPGQGQDRFTPVLAALKQTGYDGWLAIEPFDYVPDGAACAARSIGYVAGILEALA